MLNQNQSNHMGIINHRTLWKNVGVIWISFLLVHNNGQLQTQKTKLTSKVLNRSPTISFIQSVLHSNHTGNCTFFKERYKYSPIGIVQYICFNDRQKHQFECWRQQLRSVFLDLDAKLTLIKWATEREVWRGHIFIESHLFRSITLKSLSERFRIHLRHYASWNHFNVPLPSHELTRKDSLR